MSADIELFEATVQDLVSDGRGVVVHPSGRRLLVAGVWVDEVGEFELIETQGKGGSARLVRLLHPSVHRCEPLCPHHSVSGESNSQACGGCVWQFVDYDAQLTAKQQKVEQSFANIGVKYRIESIQAAPEVFGYRNRAQFKTDGKRLGFVAQRSHEISPIDDCLVLTETNRSTLRQLVERLPESTWCSERANWTTIDIDESVDAESISINQRLPFSQSNDAQNRYMQSWLADKLDKLDSSRNVLELFCGEGNFTKIIAAAGFASIYATDIAVDAVRRLSEKRLNNVITECVDIFQRQAIEALLKRSDADILVLDPPRDGLMLKDFRLMKQSRIKDVLYISCDLATLTRDIKGFIEAGFKVREIQPVDMLPQTPHIEVLVHLREKS